MGCRVTFVFAAVAIALLFALSVGGAAGWSPRRWAGALLPAAIAFAGGIALLAYNHERFGRWLEFGQSFQLWGVDYRGLHFFSPGNIPFNLQTYLFSLPQIGPYFPFLHPFSSRDTPAGYMGFEEVYGVVFMMPVHLAGLAAGAWAWRRRADPAARATAIAVAAAAGASVFAAAILFSWAGACSRYIAELLAGWTVVTSIGLMAVFGSEARPGRAVRALAAAAACWSVACVWLASAEFRGFMALTNPRTYAAFAHALDYPSAWWARARGIRFGPVELTVRVPVGAAGAPTALLASGRPQRVNLLVLENLGGGQVRLDLVENEFPVLRSAVLAVPAGRLDLRLDAPWLYPPRAHPYWDPLDPAGALERQTLFRLETDQGTFAEHSIRSADPVGFAPAVADRAQAAPGAAYIESIRPAGAPP